MTKRFSILSLLIIAIFLSGCIGGDLSTEISLQDIVNVAKNAEETLARTATFTIKSTATDEMEEEFEVSVLEAVFDNVRNFTRFTKDEIKYLQVDVDLRIVHRNNLDVLLEAEKFLGLVTYQVDPEQTLFTIWLNDDFDEDMAMVPHVEPSDDPLNLSLTIVNDLGQDLILSVDNGLVPDLPEGLSLKQLNLAKNSTLTIDFNDLFAGPLSQDGLRTLFKIEH